MTGIFKANNPSGNFLLFLYALFLKFPLFLHAAKPQLQPLDGIFYKVFLNTLSPVVAKFPLFFSVLTFLLLLLQAISFNNTVSQQRLHKQPNYLTGMSYLLITSLFTDWFSFSAPLVVNTILIWIWAKLCKLYNNADAKTTIFNIGFATGLAAFIYFPSICFLILIMVGLAIARPIRLQEWLMGLIGIITPVYFYAAFLFLFNKIHSYHFPGFRFSYPHFFGNKWAYVALVIIIFVSIVGSYFTITNLRRQVVQTRKSWQLLFLYAVVASLVSFINAGINFSYWILLTVPLAPIVASAFFYPSKKMVPIILHWAMVAICIGISYFVK